MFKRISINAISLCLLIVFAFQTQQMKASVPNVEPTDTIIPKLVSSANGTDTVYQVKIRDCDGRYTLGVKNQRIMYGYPYPFSTSHFAVNLDGVIASNSPRLALGELWDLLVAAQKKQNIFQRIFNVFKKRKLKKKKFKFTGVDYLTGDLSLSISKNGSTRMEITYYYKDISITQRCIPVDKNLDDVSETGFGQYYRIEYVIRNLGHENRKAGILLLLDTMIDDNDACQMDAFDTDDPEKMFSKIQIGKKKERQTERAYLSPDVPKRILVYHDSKKGISDLTGDVITNKKEATIPDEIYIGRWPYFYGVKWYVGIDKPRKYRDSAIIMKWKERNVAPADSVKFVTYFGLYNPGNLQLISSDKPTGGVAFHAEPRNLPLGEKAKLVWETENPLGANIKIGVIDSTENGP
ncbi:MAG: hypothetical protein KKA07_16245, partial [Bacteroidetes bacterium]|nr:hypothetical protein [Bacteroidota bacterium]